VQRPSHRTREKKKIYIYNSAKRSTHANLRSEQTHTHIYIKKETGSEESNTCIYIIYYCCYFNVFEQDRDVNRKN